jgi:hypothetical protein
VSPARLSPHGRTRVARPSPVPSSGFLPLSTVLATHAARTNSCESAVTVAPRRFAALFHAARAPGVALQSFPFPRSRTRSRGPRASMRVRGRLPPTRHTRGFAAAFPTAPGSLPSVRLGLAVTAESGQWFPAAAETGPTSCTRHGARPIAPSRVVTRRLTRPSRPLRSFAPPGSPFTSFRHLGQATEEGRCSRGRVPL